MDEETLKKLARVLCYYTEDGTMTEEAIKFECTDNTESLFIEDVKTFLKIARELVGEPLDRPRIVCLCGSTRFIDTFNEWRKLLTYEGKIVLSVEVVTSQNKETDPQYASPSLKVMLDELHLRKIDLADEVMVLNVGGYIGESTSSEINYAKKLGKTINYLEPLPT